MRTIGAARDRVVEAGRRRTAADVELAGRERRDHRLTRREGEELHREAFIFEVARCASAIQSGASVVLVRMPTRIRPGRRPLRPGVTGVA
jgi:hypothetical protein